MIRLLRRAATAVLLFTTATGCAVSNLNGAQQPAGPVPHASGMVVARRHGWTSASLDGTVPAPGSCHYRYATDGQPLPDPACTPGAVDSSVSDANRSSTICRKGGYTSTVRPPEALTQAAKRRLLAAYGVPQSQISHYELDHLIPLNDGGASDVRNLWPEPDTFRQFHKSSFIQNDKDAVEDYTYSAICSGKVAVSAVQNAMDTDWTTAVDKLGLPPIPSGYRG